MKSIRLLALLEAVILSLCVIVSAVAAPAKHKPIATKGTTQMPGGQGAFGETYTLVTSDGFGPVNFTLVSAAYSVARLNMSSTVSYEPKANEKLLVIHYRLKNPTTSDMYYSSRHLFQAIDSNDNTIDDTGDSRRESENTTVAFTMKPGQGIPDLVTCIVVPAQGPIPKLILKMGRPGTTDLVTRYMLGTAPNIVSAIPAPYADPADKSGATALATVPATIGTTYSAGYYDFSVDSVSLAPGPFGDLTADDDKQFLVAAITATNKTLGQNYFNNTIVPTVTTDDDKFTDFNSLHMDTNDSFDDMTNAGDVIHERLLIQVPKSGHLKTLTLAEAVDNTGDMSKAFAYDISNVTP